PASASAMTIDWISKAESIPRLDSASTTRADTPQDAKSAPLSGVTTDRGSGAACALTTRFRTGSWEAPSRRGDPEAKGERQSAAGGSVPANHRHHACVFESTRATGVLRAIDVPRSSLSYACCPSTTVWTVPRPEGPGRV